ncbi:excalibur calcium-binding domain-containing protein [Rhodococcus koreensis]|uniref:excalibur calcium-binding domain-containing protein n=1 Tax=Rhodococcus koreensis TaxID=99653 RepID=UPI001F12467E|nr:excalibur calcium-binding domain-containing protein [Rhodococcus koreensis]
MTTVAAPVSTSPAAVQPVAPVVPTTTIAVAPPPAPVAIPTPPPVPKSTVSYGSCDEVRAAGAAPIYKGEPGYSTKLDRDKDGIACDK